MANPVTDVVRPINSLLNYAKNKISNAGIISSVYEGTTYQGLAQIIPSLLTQAGGGPCTIVCYGGSEYAKNPRRTSTISVIVLHGHTRAVSGTSSVISAMEKVVGVLDDLIYEDTESKYVITEKWEILSDELLDIEGIEAACILLNFLVKDW